MLEIFRPAVGRICSLTLSFVLVAGPALEAVPAFASEAPAPLAASAAIPSLVSDQSWRESIETTATQDRESPAQPEPAQTTELEPTVVRELIEKRSANTTHFLLSDGTIKAEITEVPTRFEDAAGAWTDIDPRLVPAPQSGAVQTAATSATVTFDAQRPHEAPVTLSGPGYSVGFDLLGVAGNARIVYGDTTRYLDVADDADLEYRATRTGIKETVVLKSASAPNSYRFEVDLDGLEIRKDPLGGFALYRAGTDQCVFDFGALVVFDSAEGEAGEPAYCDDATMEVAATGDGDAVVSYTVPQEWLDAPERVFPVMVDPTLTGAAATADTYITSKYPSTNYGGSDELRCGYYDSTTGHNRSLVKFYWSTADIPAQAYVSSAQFSLYMFHQYYTNTQTQVHFGKVSETWGASTWDSRPGYTYIGTQLVTGRGKWVTHEVGGAVQGWVNDYSTNHGFQAYQDNNSEENTHYWKKFYSSDYSDTSKLPKLVVTYSNPGIPTSSVVNKTVYRLGDTVTAKIRVNTTIPEDINAIKAFVNWTADDDTQAVRRGTYQWTETEPTSDWGTPTLCPGLGGGFVAEHEPSSGSSTVDLLETKCLENIVDTNDYAEVTFVWKIDDSYGDIQNNDIDVQVMMDPVDKGNTGNRWTSAIKKIDTDFDVAPRPLTAFSVDTTASGWFRQSIETSTGDVLDRNDRADEGRGAFDLSWAPVVGATGYKVLLSDGNAEREVGRTFGASETTFTTSGLGIYPSDSIVAGYGALPPTRNPFGSSPLETSSLVTSFNSDQAGTGVIVTDGTYLYVHKWSTYPGSAAWQRVRSGLSSGTAGTTVKQVGASSGRDLMSAAMIDGKIYEGYAVTKQTLEGVWKDEPSSSSVRSTLSLDKPLLTRYGLSEVTGATADIMITADAEAGRLYSISHDRVAATATFKIREYAINPTATGAAFVADHVVTLPGQGPFNHLDGVFAARGQLFLTEWYGGSRVVRVDAQQWRGNGMWTLDGGTASRLIGACYDPVSHSVFGGSLDTATIRRYAGPMFDLRDEPAGLYQSTPGTINDADELCRSRAGHHRQQGQLACARQPHSDRGSGSPAYDL